MFWEYSSYSTNLASDWLRAESSPVDEKERQKRKTVSILHSLRSELTYLLTWGGALVSGIQNDIVVIVELPCEE